MFSAKLIRYKVTHSKIVLSATSISYQPFQLHYTPRRHVFESKLIYYTLGTMIEYVHDSQSIALSLKLTVSLSKPLIVSMEVPTCGDHPDPSQLLFEP